jgi:hypothetical protein
VRVKLALRNALESEAEFVEAEDADAQLLALLRKPLSRPFSHAKQGQDEQVKTPSSPAPGNRRPGKRAPGRDSTGTAASEEERRELAEEERAAG